MGEVGAGGAIMEVGVVGVVVEGADQMEKIDDHPRQAKKSRKLVAGAEAAGMDAI